MLQIMGEIFDRQLNSNNHQLRSNYWLRLALAAAHASPFLGENPRITIKIRRIRYWGEGGHFSEILGIDFSSKYASVVNFLKRKIMNSKGKSEY